ncbi:MAG: A/G-specific adenine glycosylase [Candidatus Acidiferrales bacterium]
MTLAPRQLAPFRRSLLAWYRANRRDLPWRRGRDPYRIWLAEIMLQQTRIAAVLPYYERFLARFPTVRTLARARESEVLKYWAGLGYYSRARNLHRSAKQIVAKHNAQFPPNVDRALALPGIGRYTAAAILSIAFDVPLAALDGNVARVLARLFAIRGDLRAPKTWKRLASTAQQLLPTQSPGDWNEALMELGETVCTPRSPQCARCPISRQCKARALGLEGTLPAARRKREPSRMRIAAAVLLDPRGRTLLTKNPGAHDSALFSRLWQFPAVAVASTNGDAARELSAHLQSTLNLAPRSLLQLPAASHTVTYRQLALLPFLARVNALPDSPACRTALLENMTTLAISSATRKIARAALEAVGASSQ